MKKNFFERIEKIGQNLGIFEQKNEELATEKCEDVKDNNGNIIRITEFAVGAKAQLISTDGTLIDLEDGEYTLEDGKTFTIQNGVIATISSDIKEEEKKDTETPKEVIQPINAEEKPEEKVEEKPEEKVEEKPEEEKPNEKPSEEIETRISSLEEAVEKILEMIEGMSELKSSKKNFEAEKKELEKKVKELEMKSAGDPIEIKAASQKETKKAEKIENKDSKSFGNFWNNNVDYSEKFKEFQELSKKTRK